MIRVAMVLMVIGSVAMPSAQTPASPPAFEVASVKPNTSGSSNQSSRSANGSLTISNMSLRMLVVNAYRVRPERVLGGPSWVDSERFDVNARTPEGSADDQLSLMLRALLTERFKLAARMETQEQPIYALVVARADGRLGPALKPSTQCASGAGASGSGAFLAVPEPGRLAPCGTRSSIDATGGTIVGGARTMGDLVRTLDGIAGRPVVDRTGLAGTFDFVLRFARPSLQSNVGVDSDLPTVFTAVQEQLGLKLEPSRGPVDVLVIDGVERPTPD